MCSLGVWCGLFWVFFLVLFVFLFFLGWWSWFFVVRFFVLFVVCFVLLFHVGVHFLFVLSGQCFCDGLGGVSVLVVGWVVVFGGVW